MKNTILILKFHGLGIFHREGLISLVVRSFMVKGAVSPDAVRLSTSTTRSDDTSLYDCYFWISSKGTKAGAPVCVCISVQEMFMGPDLPHPTYVD